MSLLFLGNLTISSAESTSGNSSIIKEEAAMKTSPLITFSGFQTITVHQHDGLGFHLHNGVIGSHTHDTTTTTSTTSTTVAPAIFIKRGLCPRLRNSCLNVSSPVVCIQDGQCSGTDKCCFDRCLNLTVCQPVRRRRPFNRNRG